jgi:membrane protein implicated in regulation of membrane protease activity
MLPATIIYVVGADAVSQSLGGRVPWPLIGLLVVAVVVVTLIVRFARRELSTRQARADSRLGQ